MSRRDAAQCKGDRFVRSAALIWPAIDTALPIVLGIVAMYALGAVASVYEDADYEMPRFSAWLLERRWLVPLMLLPAAACGIAIGFVHRRYLLYGPYLFFLLVPLIIAGVALALLILSVYAQAMDATG